MLNENIRILRKNKGMSQEELASRLQVVRQTVSKWEKGLSVPDAQMLIRLAEALDTTVNTLLGETVPEENIVETVATLAAKLENLNRQFAEQAEKKRRIRRSLCWILAGISLAGLVCESIFLIELYQVRNAMEASTSMIGGADGPTSILVTSRYFWPNASILGTTIAALISAWGLYYTRKK